MKRIISLGIVSLIISVWVNAQTEINPLKINGYIETYYIYDFANPSNHTRPNFFYSFNRHNEVNLNLGYIQAEYDNNKVRGKLALMTGTYANANLSAETELLKNIYEANIGVKLSGTNNIWIDAGIFASHIGFESAVSANCWNMTRSILAENSPYFESGVKLSYTTNDGKWFLSGLILNGWQRIQRVDGNNTPALGHQITWMPNSKLTINSSSFIGNDSPDNVRKMRYFHNLYGIYQATESFGLTLGFDIGIQQKEKNSLTYDLWYAPVLLARYSPNKTIAFAARTEFYADKNGVIISTGTPNGFQTIGYSVNMDVRLTDNVLWRIEGRILNSTKDMIFANNNQSPTANNFFAGTSLSVKF